MFNNLSRSFYSVLSIVLVSFFSVSLTACKSAEPPKLMKAVTQFESDEIRDQHILRMRKNHKDDLLHKRDETLIKGIRTEKNSLKACINCHVPEKYNGEILRHTNPEHFCSTCHGFVAQQLDCFECHVDHPVSENSSTAEMPNDSIYIKQASLISSETVLVVNTVQEDSIDINVVEGESTSE